MGYAVEPELRGQGRAKSIVTAALNEFETGMRRADALPQYIEVVVGADNAASLRVANLLFGDGEPITDSVSACRRCAS